MINYEELTWFTTAETSDFVLLKLEDFFTGMTGSVAILSMSGRCAMSLTSVEDVRLTMSSLICKRRKTKKNVGYPFAKWFAKWFSTAQDLSYPV